MDVVLLHSYFCLCSVICKRNMWYWGCNISEYYRVRERGVGEGEGYDGNMNVWRTDELAVVGK